MKNTPFVEALKEALRYAVLMAASAFVSTLLRELTSFQSKDSYIILLTLILRIVDKYLHEKRKERNAWGYSKSAGLLPF